MPKKLLPLKIPPGVVDRGTEYATMGRWYRANQVRWRDGILQPVGGWQSWASGLTGRARAIRTWRSNSGGRWAGVGTHTGLYVAKGGAVFDVTPAGFTEGRQDGIEALGYGVGPYGAGAYGSPRPDATLLRASTWSLDTWGEYLVGVAPHDGTVVEWRLDTAAPAAPIENAPSGAAVLVTGERVLMVVGAAGNPRLAAWCDQEDNTDWVPTPTNLAGDYELKADGELIAACPVRGGYLIFGTADVHLVRYVGRPLGYGFERLAGAGLLGPVGYATFEGNAAWWGPGQNFYVYRGQGVEPLPCDLADYIWGDINLTQRSKFHASTVEANQEVWFWYCSAGSDEIDRYVIWSWKEGWWSMGEGIPRTAWADRGTFARPLAASPGGVIYEHELGVQADGASRAGVPWARSGPVEIGDGDQMMWVDQLIPDEHTQGEVTVAFTGRYTPLSDELEYGPFALEDYTDVRMLARQLAVEVRQAVDDDWRFGTLRLSAVPGPRR